MVRTRGYWLGMNRTYSVYVVSLVDSTVHSSLI